MTKINYKIGDTIKMTKDQKERFGIIESRLDGAKLAIAFLSEVYSTCAKQAWGFVKLEYPELYKKYHLSISDSKVRIDMLKIGENDE